MSAAQAPWAGTANYPAGAPDWSGTPTKVQPPYSYFTPNSPPAAQELNWLLNQRDGQIGAIALGLWAAAAANWSEPTSDIGGTTLQSCPTNAWWDAFAGQWLVTCAVPQAPGPVSMLMCSYDGSTWFGIAGGITGSSARVPWAVASNPTTGDIVVLRSDGTTSSITRWAGGTGSGTDTTQAAFGGTNQGALTYWNGAFWLVGATALGLGTWTGHAATSTDGSGTWTDETASLPTGWASATANVIVQWLTAQTATTLAVAMCAQTPGTHTSRLMSQTSASPGTWTDITPSVLGGTAKQIRGLCYSSNDGLWGLLAVDASNSYLYTSPDLATWTLVHTFTGCIASGVATIGSVWAVLTWNQTLSEGGNRIQISTNVGSLGASSTWGFGRYSEATSGQATTPASNPAGLLLSNGQQLLRCEILRLLFTSGLRYGGMVAASDVALFSGSVATVAPTSPSFSAPTVRVNHTTSPTTGPWSKASTMELQFWADVSAGTVGIDTGLVALQDGGKVRVVNANGDMSANPVTLSDASGRQFEQPGAPMTFASTATLNVKGASYDYALDTLFNRWKLV